MESKERPKDAALSYRGVGKERRRVKGGVDLPQPRPGNATEQRLWRLAMARHLRTWSALRDGRELERGRLRCGCGACVGWEARWAGG